MKGDINVDFVMAVILFVSVYAMLYMLLPGATISFKKTPDPLWTASHYFADVLMTSPGIPSNWGTIGEVQRLGLAYGDNVTSYSNILDAKKIGAIQGQTCSLLKSKTDTLLDFSIAVDIVNASAGGGSLLGDGWSYRKAITIDNSANNNSLTDYQVLVTNPVYNETGLVGSWHFDEGYGNYTSDGSGNGNDGTYYNENRNDGALVNNPTWVDGKYGKALQLGTTGYVNTGNASTLNGNDSFTVMAWVKTSDSDGLWDMIVSKDYGDYAIKGWRMIDRIGYEQVMMGNGTSYESIITSNWIADGLWHHWAIKLESKKNMTIYLDGVQTGNRMMVADFFPSLSNVTIGPFPQGGGAYGNFTGTVDSVRMFGRSLTRAEIQTEMSSSKPVATPIAAWEFDEGSGNVAKDTHIWTNGTFDSALGFNGNNTYVMVPDSGLNSISEYLSVSTWVKYDEWKNIGIVWKHSYNYILYGPEGGNIRFILWNTTGSTSETSFSSSLMTLGKWHYIVGVFGPDRQAKLYLDGAAVGTAGGVLNGPIRDQGGDLYLGVRGDNVGNSPYHHNGSIDEVRIYNRSLSPSEIQEMYQAKAKLNYADMRFTANDGSTLLNHWKEADGKFWVKVPAIPSLNTTTIYVYYGNPDANSTSNGPAAFQFFDDFAGDSLNTSRWDVDATNYSVSGSILRVNIGSIGMINPLAFYLNNGYTLEGKMTHYGGGLAYGGTLSGVSSEYTQSSNAGSDATLLYLRQYNSQSVGIYIGSGSSASYEIVNGAVVFASTENVPYVFGEKLDATGAKLMRDRAIQSTYSFNWSKNLRYISLGGFYGGSTYDIQDTGYDWILVRKYSATEPTTYIGNPQSGGGVGNNCNYRKKLNFTNSWNNENLVNFPVLVKLNSSRIDYSTTSATDIRFYDSDGTALLPKETELWNASGNSYLWVKVPQINANTNADYIYAYYGCSDTNPDDKTNVWDSGYKLVQHLAESTAPIYDSTSNGNNGTISGTTYNSTGKIDGARAYPGQGDYIYSSGLSNYNFTDGITVEAWAYVRNVSSSGVASIVNIGPQGGPYWWFYIGALSVTAGTFKVEYSSTCSNFVDATQTSQIIPWSTWNHLVVTHNFTTGYLTYYLNGAQVSNATWSNVCAFKKAAYIGSYAGASGYSINGSLDEVRISSVSRSVKWVNATYLAETDNFIAYEGEQSGAWAADNCGYRKKINFTNSWNPENLTNFPALIKLNSNRIDYSKTSAGDIRFYDADGTTLLSKETELWNTSGESYVWVKVPKIDASSNTDYVYAYYSCANTNADDRTNVWDSNFKMVQHFKETSGNTVYDSTGYGRNGTAFNGVFKNASGKIDGANTLDESSGFINISGMDFMLNNYTIEGWFNGNSISNNDILVATNMTDDGHGILFELNSNQLRFLHRYPSGGTGGDNLYSTVTMSPGTWYYVAGVRGDKMYIYVNGSKASELVITNGAFTYNLNILLGKLSQLQNTRYMNGTLDEIRLSSIARSAGWINASYLSESDNFASYGSEEGVGVTNRVGNNCNYRKKLGFSNYWNQENLTNFPVLIKLNSSRIDYSKTGATDIRFYDYNGATLLPKETELWNSSGDSYLWVKVPKIDAGTNADYIYAYYGCSDTNLDSKTGVWESNFKLVQHLEETSGTANDSTIYGNNGSINGGVNQNVAGKIGGAYNFNGVNSYVFANTTQISNKQTVTMSAWFQANIKLGNWSNPLSLQTTNTTDTDYLRFEATTNGTQVAFYVYGTATCTPLTTHMYVNNEWINLVITSNGTNVLFYINGAQTGCTTATWRPGFNLIGDTYIGKRGPIGGFINGTVDEVRVSNASRSAAWINASYLSESDNFVSYGTEETSSSTQNNCNYRKKINLTNSWNPETLIDFPLLIKLTSNKIDYSKTNATDIRFYDDNGISLLPKETELWNSSGDSYVWVKVPRINANSNSDYIYAYYGCTNSNSDDKNSVWDSSFRMVHHLSESGGTHYDSSSYANNGTINGSTQNTSGKIDGADQFDGINNYVQINDGFSLNSNQITFSAWVNLNGSNYAHSVVGSWNSTNGYNLIMTMYPQTGWIYFYIRGTDGSVHGAYTTSCPTNQWVQITETYNGSVMKIYLNGAERPEATTSTSFTIVTFITAPRIGETEYSSDRQYFKGTIDEVRVSNVTKNAAWINASYLSETDGFTSFGSEQDLRNTNLVGNDCNYREKFTFNNSWNSENLTNFPVLVKLSPARIDYAKTSATDIRFYDADTTTLLPKETESWNSSGDSYLWVKIPQIDAGTNSDYIYAYYGCSNTNPDDKYSVWNPNYKMAHHLEEKSGTVYDSTVYGFNGTAYGGTTQNAVGKIDGSYEFDGSNDYVSTGSPSTPDGLTVSLWVKARNLTTGYPKLSVIANSLIGLDPNGRIWSWLLTDNEGWHGMGSTTNTYSWVNEWHQIMFTYNSTTNTTKYYRDGIEVFSNTGTATGKINETAMPGVLGMENGQYFNGTIDEWKVTNVSKSIYWINASYLSENDAFINYGLEESGVSGTYSCSSTIPKKARLIERIGYLKNGTEYTPIKVKIWTW